MGVDYYNGEKQDETKKTDNSDANDPIRRSIGDFGSWQLYIILALSIVRMPLACHQLGIVFLAPKVDFNCTLAEGEVEPEWSAPAVEQSVILKWLASIAKNSLGEGNYNTTQDQRCFKDGKPCVKWEYNKEVFTSTIISEWDLVCNKQSLADVAQLVFMFGVLIGSILFGMAADRWGRKKPIMVSLILQIACGIGGTFVDDYVVYLVLRFFDAVGTGGGLVVCYVICLEFLSKKWRTVVSTLIHAPFFLGHALLPLVSYFFRDWRDYQRVITYPFIIFLLYGLFVPESPRWLLAVGRKEEALRILQQIAKVNKLPRPEMETIDVVKMNDTPKNATKKNTLIDIFKMPNMRKWALCLYLQWFTIGICYFGLAQYMSKMGGNIFLNVAISGAVEVPGAFIALYGLQKFGRKWTLAFFTLLTGVSCLLIIAVPNDADVYYSVALGTIGTIGTSVIFPAIYVFSGEVFPTVVRNNGIGTCSMIGRIGSMVAPFVTSMVGILPPLIFGIVPIFAAAAIYFLPETSNWKLPTTLEEAEEYGSSRSRRKGMENKGFDSA